MGILEEVFQLRSPKTVFPLLDPIKKRFSPRIFSNDPILSEHLEIIFEAARLAPSGRNNQPWKYFWMRKGTEAYKKIFTCIPERNLWASSAPIIIMSLYNPVEPSEGSPVNKWAQYDLGAANISLILQAQELGYYSRQIGSFDTDKAKEIFNIEDPYIPFILIAMGKIGTEEDYKNANQEFVQKDLDKHNRKEKIDKELI
jgi:nitroreductase